MVIRQSFLFLLKEQAIEKITVADICRLAEINRATFYRHYENQYSVLFELETDLLHQIQPSEETQSPEEFLQTTFQSLAEKKEDWLLLLSSHADPGFPAKLYHFLEQHLPGPGDDMRYRFLLHGLSGLLMDWMSGGFRETAEQMTGCAVQYFQDLTGRP